MVVGRRAVPTGLRALRWIAATLAAIGLIAAVPRAAGADGFPKEDPAKAMMLLLSMSQSMSQKGINAPRPRAEPAPVDGAVAPTEAAPTPASVVTPSATTAAPDPGH